LLAPREVAAVIGRSGHRIHPGDAYRNIRVTELSGGGPKPLYKPALLQISLPAIRHDECHPRADSGDNHQRDFEDINGRWSLRVGVRIEYSTYCEGQDDCEKRTSQDPEGDRAEQ
jgi:hypothetical protein